MMILGFSFSAIVVLISLCLGACSVERWAVKTGTDAGASRVDLSRAIPTTIAALGALPVPARLPDEARVAPTETTLYVVSATLQKYKVAADSDYHLVLADDSGHTLIAEIPDPTDLDSHSPFTSEIQAARAEFDKRYAPLPFVFKTANVPVCVKGVGFFDFHHGQPGIAPNGIELHPVLDIQFNPSSCNSGVDGDTTPHGR